MNSNDWGDLEAKFRRMAADAEEHQRTCKAAECARCERYLCVKCKSPVRTLGLCADCESKRAQTRWTRKAMELVPRGFADADLNAEWLVRLVGPKVIAEARTALAEPRIVAVGSPGSGKTSLVCAMFKAARFTDSAMYVSAHQLAKARALHPLGEGEAPLIDRALSASGLVIDELGGEDQRYASAVAEVLFERHAEDLPTWVTTGVGPKEIADRYGGGIARRVFEDARVFRLARR